MTALQQPRTLYEKLCDAHRVRRIDDAHDLLYVDLHVINEYTSPQAFSGLREAGRPIWRPAAHLAVIDHVNPTRAGVAVAADAQLLIDTLSGNCAAAGIEMFGRDHPSQGIEHVVVPELGLAQPGMVIVCGDSHTTTYGAFGALGFGIGTSEVEHVLATQTIVYRRLAPMLVTLDGVAGTHVTAKDMIMAVIGQIGAAGASGHAVEFSGNAAAALTVEARMTLCNMAVEAGARGALIAPDDTTVAYLDGRPRAPKAAHLADARRRWAGLHSDPGALYARAVSIDVARLAPLVTWGTSPDQVIPIDGIVPDPAAETDPARRTAARRALDYMDLVPGAPLADLRIDVAFIGSCTNSRIEDLRAAAAVLAGRRIAPHVRAIVVPGSWDVRRQAEREGLDRTFVAAGFEWRTPGCSMCLAMNDDVAPPGTRLASSTNRNFEGRQGRGARTHLMSPAMVAASAIRGVLSDVRRLEGG